MKFYDREKELSLLDREFEIVRNKRLSRFVVISGRRRVGKTALVMKAAERNTDFVSVYLYAFATTESGLTQRWMQKVAEKFNLEFPPTFSQPVDVIRFLFSLAKKTPTAVFIDECQDITPVSPTFWSELQREWDLNKDSSQMLLVQSGSVASAMRLIFQDYSKPLYGRADAFLELQPFGPQVLQTILKDAKPNYSPDELLLLYAMTGGVARYVRQMVDTDALTVDRMTEEFFHDSSYFLSEAQILLANEFKVESGIYYDILAAIAHGVTKRMELQNVTAGKQVGGYLDKLQKLFGLIRKNEPLFNKDYRKVRYVLNDPYLSFWFAFVQREEDLVSTRQFDELKRLFRSHYSDYSGRVLEGWFRAKFLESGLYPEVGSWWDRKGENEIDLIAVNAERRVAWVFEIKRNPKKFDPTVLQRKTAVMLGQNNRLEGFDIRTKGLSLEDMVRPVTELAPL